LAAPARLGNLRSLVRVDFQSMVVDLSDDPLLQEEI
jgi:hypothetical protein